MPRILRNPNLGSAILTGPTQQPRILRGRELDPGGPFPRPWPPRANGLYVVVVGEGECVPFLRSAAMYASSA